jgi:hypothetical protein
MLPELDEVEGLDVRGKEEVQSTEYDLPLAKALRAIEFDEVLCWKAWTDEGLEEVFTALDSSDEHNLTEEHKQILRSRNLEAMKEALAEEKEVAGVPKSAVIVWVLVRI